MRYLTLIVFLCLVPAVASSQTGDRTTVVPLRTGSIAGRVISDGASPQAIRRAVVMLKGGSIAPRSAVTDDEGRFMFETLAPGRFTLTVTKAAYLETSVGAAQPVGAGSQILIVGSDHVEVTLKLSYGAILEGTVRNSSGDLLSGITVRMLRVTGVTELKSLAQGETDDRGIYRLFGLPPGDYVVSAEMPANGLMPGAIARPSGPEIDRTLGTLLQSNRNAVPRMAESGPAAVQAAFTFAPLYFPGVALVEDAAPVKLGPGEERTGVDFVFEPLSMANVTGSVFGAVGDLGGVQIQLQPAGLARSGNQRTIHPSSDGMFTFRNVPPGRYRLVARVNSAQVMTSSPKTETVSKAVSREKTIDEALLYATANVETRGEDVAGIALVLQPGGTLSGHFKFEGTTSVGESAMRTIQLTLSPLTSLAAPVIQADGFTLTRQARIHQNGTFVLDGIAPGRYKLSVTLPPALSKSGWRTSSALVDTHDLFDVDPEITPALAIDNVIVTLSDRSTLVSGVVQGPTPSSLLVIAFSTNREAWSVTGRRTRVVRPLSDGTFEMTDLPPGDYFIAAFAVTDPAELASPALFDSLLQGAARVTLDSLRPSVRGLQVSP